MADRGGVRVMLVVLLTFTAAAGCSGTKSNASGGSTDTIPLPKNSATTQMFAALDIFQGCLKGAGVKFIGAPDPSNPGSPTNDPTYVQNLAKCAAKSNIVQALANQNKAFDNLTPAQVEAGNKGYLKWRDCMIGRGWGIPQPTPDAKGRLFAFGGAGSAPPAFVPPPGQDLLTSGDLKGCAAQVQKEDPGAFPNGI